MSKAKRSERISMILLMLSQQPNKLFTLSHFAEQFGCAKSTLSEDMTAVRDVLEMNGLGKIETVAGAAGGVKFMPFSRMEDNYKFIVDVCKELTESTRIMPGGFVYTVDIFSNPLYIRKMGEIFAQIYYKTDPDVVVTVESKGVPIGVMTAQALSKPLIIARKENRATEGSVVTLNYISTSSRRLQTMSLPRRAVKEGQKALIVDDFVKGGGTVGAICDMMKEFSVSVVGIGALIASPQHDAPKRIREVKALMILDGVDQENECICMRPAAWLSQSSGK